MTQCQVTGYVQTCIRRRYVVSSGSVIVGLTAALFVRLDFALLQVMVLVRGMLPYGASSRNAGFACYGSPSELLDDLTHQSVSETVALVDKRYRGLHKLRQLIGDDKLKYESLGGYELFFESDDELYRQCVDLLPTLNKYLKEISGDANVYVLADEKIREFGFGHTSHLLFNKNEGQIDTGSMMQQLLLLCQEMECRF